jgi:hypothetical protein
MAERRLSVGERRDRLRPATHEKGIVHRDLSPEKVIVDRRKSRETKSWHIE